MHLNTFHTSKRTFTNNRVHPPENEFYAFDHIFQHKKKFYKNSNSTPLKINFIIFKNFHEKTKNYAFEQIFQHKKNFYKNRFSNPLKIYFYKYSNSCPPENQFYHISKFS